MTTLWIPEAQRGRIKPDCSSSSRTSAAGVAQWLGTVHSELHHVARRGVLREAELQGLQQIKTPKCAGLQILDMHRGTPRIRP